MLPAGCLRRLLLFCVALSALTVVVLLSEDLNEYVEHQWIKKGLFHHLLHTSRRTTHIDAKEELIVYVHVPRTSGETLKVTLFNDVAYQYHPEWVDSLHCDEDCMTFWTCKGEVWNASKP